MLIGWYSRCCCTTPSLIGPWTPWRPSTCSTTSSRSSTQHWAPLWGEITWSTSVSAGESYGGGRGWTYTCVIGKSCKRCVCVWQRQSELQQGGRAGAAAAPGEAEGGGGGHGAQCGGAGQPAHPTSHGPQEPQQTLPRVAGLGLDLRVCLCRIKSRFLPDSWGRCCADAMEETDTFSDRLFKIKTVHFISFAPDGTNFAL